jgi:hypothetical protein
MDSNVQWHNESKGVMMINQYFKQSANLDDKIKSLGTKLLDMDEKIEAGLIEGAVEEKEEPTDFEEKATDEQSAAFSSLMKTPDSAYMSL